MKSMRLVALLLVALSFGACSKSGGPIIPDITGIVVDKGDRKMYLVSKNTVKKTYDISLGFAPTGDKKIRGDGKTPEGTYIIDRKNPNSQFYLSLGINYPNINDVAEARALGQNAGGDIFIHGRSGTDWTTKRDWTAGCIAVKNDEIREIYQSVRIGTPIFIRP